MYLDEKKEGEAQLDEVSQLLLKAAEIVERYGHIQESYGDTDRGFCIHGAIWFAVDPKMDAFEPDQEHVTWEAGMRVARYLKDEEALQDCDWDRCVSWNDTDGRTAEEVIAALRGAAA